MWQWNEDWLVREHQKDLLEEAQKQHLLRLVQGDRRAASAYYAPALAWIGRQLSGFGVRLQNRYTPVGLRGEPGDA